MSVDAARDAPSLTDEEIARVRDLIGVWLRRDVHWPAMSEPISLHDIRRYALYSIGDDNPLWMDEEYGKRSPYGSVIAPPTFLYTIDTTIVAPGLPGIQWIHGGNRWRFHRPVRPGDTIRAKARLIDVKEKSGSRAERFVIQTGEVYFVNQRDQLVARTECDILRIPRRRSGQGLRLGDGDGKEVEVAYTDEQIQQIDKAYEQEFRRGSDPLYWEEVEEGEELPTLVKGPLTLVDIVGFYAGRRNVYNVLKLAFAERHRHPRNVYVSPSTGIPVHPAAGHFDYEIAREVGMPTAYDQGWMRINWLGHLITNWAGDHGFVKRLDVRNSTPNFVGWLSSCKGTVERKFPDSQDNGCVDLALSITNQDGNELSRGSATVMLPSRSLASKHPWALRDVDES